MASAIGIDIGGTNMRGARVSPAGAIEAFRSQATPRTAAEVAAAVDMLIAAVDDGHAASIGIGIPGRVDARTGRIFSGGFVDLSGVRFSDRISRPVFVDNDANMALVAEAGIGAARGLSSVVLLTIGTGIGGALMDGGAIVHGKATAGQLGHITVDVDGGPCNCGRQGCLETTSSGTALRRLMAAAGFGASVSVDELLQREDETAVAVLRGWARPLRAGIDSLVAAFDPERVVLGGGLGAAACRALAGYPAISPWYQCEVVAARCGDDAGVIGAALASRRTGS
jgi:glucokinase